MSVRHSLVMLAVAVIAGLALWYSLHRSKSDHMAATMEDASPMVTNLNIPALSNVEKLGKQHFDENCAACHGENAAGREGAGPPLVHKIYEPSHHADISFQLAVKNGVRSHHWRFGNMPPVPTVSEADVETIISYVRSLQRANGIF